MQLSVPIGSKPEVGLTVWVSKLTSTIAPLVTKAEANAGFVRIGTSGDYIYVDEKDVPAPPTQNNKGTTWSAIVTTPVAYQSQGFGIWNWLQIITLGSSRTVPAGNQEEFCIGPYGTELYKVGVDTGIPYEPGGTGWPNGWAADGLRHSASDPPGDTLEAIASAYNWRLDFKDYLMYRPLGTGSDWVPLRKLIWHCGGTATKSGQSWTLSNPSCAALIGTTIPEHPSWEHLVKAFWNAWRP